MKPDHLLRAILPEVLIDNFDIDRFEKTDSRFDIWLDEKKTIAGAVLKGKHSACRVWLWWGAIVVWVKGAVSFWGRSLADMRVESCR